MKSVKKEKKLIGWREQGAIPALGIKEIKIKVDTGARTSALHVTNLKIVKRGSTQFAQFIVHPKQRSSTPQIANRCRIYGFKNVKSSNGVTSKRPVIKTDIVLDNEKKEIEITLVDRDLMGFRMLLGRAAMKGSYIVDPSKSYLLSKKK
jgi:hypothetical protein